MLKEVAQSKSESVFGKGFMNIKNHKKIIGATPKVRGR